MSIFFVITHQTEQSGLARVYEDDISKPKNIKTIVNRTNTKTKAFKIRATLRVIDFKAPVLVNDNQIIFKIRV